MVLYYIYLVHSICSTISGQCVKYLLIDTEIGSFFVSFFTGFFVKGKKQQKQSLALLRIPVAVCSPCGRPVDTCRDMIAVYFQVISVIGKIILSLTSYVFPLAAVARYELGEFVYNNIQ